jgi:hypothetical protein
MRRWTGRLWRGELPLVQAFWEYAIGYGTLLHIAMTGIAYGAYVAGAPLWAAAVLYLLPAPYALLVTVGVWRSAGSYRGPQHWAQAARASVVVWAILATVL